MEVRTRRIATMKEETGGLSPLVEVMEHARSCALLDEWDVRGNIVRLTIGTYEIELQPNAAHRFVRGLLRTHEATLNAPREQ